MDSVYSGSLGCFAVRRHTAREAKSPATPTQWRSDRLLAPPGDLGRTAPEPSFDSHEPVLANAGRRGRGPRLLFPLVSAELLRVFRGFFIFSVSGIVDSLFRRRLRTMARK